MNSTLFVAKSDIRAPVAQWNRASVFGFLVLAVAEGLPVRYSVGFRMYSTPKYSLTSGTWAPFGRHIGRPPLLGNTAYKAVVR